MAAEAAPLSQTTGKSHPTTNGTVPHRLASIAGISLAAIGTTTLYTTPAGKTAIPLYIVLECTAAVSVTTPATAGVGVAAGEDDVAPSQKLTNFDTAGDVWTFILHAKGRTIPAASALKLGVDTAITGTSQTVTAHVFGFLV